METVTNEFDLRVDDLSNFAHSAGKDNAANDASVTTLILAKGNNSTAHDTKEKIIWTPKETARRESKLPCQKNNPRINHNSLTSEEADTLKLWNR